jgi:hypothetical protein
MEEEEIKVWFPLESVFKRANSYLILRQEVMYVTRVNIRMSEEGA